MPPVPPLLLRLCRAPRGSSCRRWRHGQAPALCHLLEKVPSSEKKCGGRKWEARRPPDSLALNCGVLLVWAEGARGPPGETRRRCCPLPRRLAGAGRHAPRRQAPCRPPWGTRDCGGRAQTLGRALLPGCTRPLPPCGSWRLEGGLKKIIT